MGKPIGKGGEVLIEKRECSIGKPIGKGVQVLR